MNRRDFLDPRQVALAAGQAYAAVEELQPTPCQPLADELTLLRCAHQAMATTFEVMLAHCLEDFYPLADAAFALIDQLEAQLTVYRDSSEVCDINRRAAHEAIPVELQLFQLLELCAALTRETEGAFDVSAGALIKAWGFFKGPPRVPDPRERQEACSRVGMRHVALDGMSSTVRFHRPGLELNFGSIGKGYALDRVARMLRRDWNLDCALLHGGYSSVYAMGSPPGSDAGWPVGIRHPWKDDERLTIVYLKDRALGTSATRVRHLEWRGRKLGHILDPRTGWPAEGMVFASALAPTAAEADALATAFFIQGVAWAKKYCERHPGIGAVLLPEGVERVECFGEA
jgi:thiamine biosynthesis lipoprotein